MSTVIIVVFIFKLSRRKKNKEHTLKILSRIRVKNCSKQWEKGLISSIKRPPFEHFYRWGFTSLNSRILTGKGKSNWANNSLLTLWIQLDFTLITAGEALFPRSFSLSVSKNRHNRRSRRLFGKLTCPNTVRNLQQAKFDATMCDWLSKSRQWTYKTGEPERNEAFTSSNSMVNEGSRVKLNLII